MREGEMSGGRVSTASELRARFDGAFAAPRAAPLPPPEHLLAVRIAGQWYALPIGGMRGIVDAGCVRTVPTQLAELVGVTVVRGTVVPVYSAARLLGSDERSHGPWLVVVGTPPDLIALVVETIGRVIQVAATERHAVEVPQPHVSAAVNSGGIVYLVVDLDSVSAAVKALASAWNRNKECAT